ncbi:MAG: long-chain fatty acid--CoA ligase [Microthrixaceae bacterium]
MRGTMQDRPLTLDHFVDRAETYFADREIATNTPAGLERTTYGEWAERTHKLAGVLDTLGISDDGRVGTFAWNTARHLELYFAAPCSGRVLHTLNLRLFPEQLTYIVNHAEDEVIFVDRSLLGLLVPRVGEFTSVKHLVVMDDGVPNEIPSFDDGPEVHDYEELLAAAERTEFRCNDEYAAASMCYTSGTTGNPKGVTYTHRSTYLHTMGAMLADSIGVAESDVILPVVPMFHANAWGLAHAAVASGAKLVNPGPDLSPPTLARLIEEERVTLAAGVPTIWMGVVEELVGRDTSALRVVPCGGSAVPTSLSKRFEEVTGLPILQAWGMTETSPVGSVAKVMSTLEDAPEEKLDELRGSQGLPVLGVELRVVTPDGEPVPWDGETQGELQAAGPWITNGYYNDDRSAESMTEDGWCRTGDVAVMLPEGYLKLVDRTKDVIKTGGEWISSVELENEIMAHEAVAEAAVIAVAHPKWAERPLACVVLREGAEATKQDILDFLDGRVAKWWIPDDVVFIDEVPKTSVGKFSKKTLRERFADYELPTAGD